MRIASNFWSQLISGLGGSPPARRRRPQRLSLSWDALEDRKVLSHASTLQSHAQAVANALVRAAANTAEHGRTHTSAANNNNTTTTTSSGGSSSSSNSTLATALQTLHSDVQNIELASSTTVGELTAIRAAFQTLSSDGLTPSSQSALSSFEDSLVTAFASGTTLTGNSTLLSQFEAIYTSNPTAQQTTDLTTAYNALAAAVTSSNITSANITTINNDWSAVLAAENSTSTASYPYFSLVTGGGGHGPGGGGGGCH